jgi:hypothetical protein
MAEIEKPIFRDTRRYFCEYCGICRSKKSLISSHILTHHKVCIYLSLSLFSLSLSLSLICVCLYIEIAIYFFFVFLLFRQRWRRRVLMKKRK